MDGRNVPKSSTPSFSTFHFFNWLLIARAPLDRLRKVGEGARVDRKTTGGGNQEGARRQYERRQAHGNLKSGAVWMVLSGQGRDRDRQVRK